MRNDVGVSLENELDSLQRTPHARLTAEQFFPEWTAKISGLSGAKLEQYAAGHSACVVANGAGANSDVLIRVRSGSYANPQNGNLYIAIVKEEDLADAENWESLWQSTGISSVMYPAWTSNSGAQYGAAMAVVPGSAGQVRVFYFDQSGNLKASDFDISDGSHVNTDTISTHPVDASMILASSLYTEVYVLYTLEVEQGYASWHKPVHGSHIRRFYYNGGWQVDNSFLYHTHAEAHGLKDTDTYDSANTEITTQWGKRPHGGLAVHSIDSNTRCISTGLTYWRRWGYSTNSQGLMAFLHYLDSGGVWGYGFEAGVADYAKGMRFSFDVMARGCKVEGNNFVVWNRNDESIGVEQANGAERVPRLRETVYAKLDNTGKNITQFQRLGDQDELTCASIAATNYDGEKRLFAIGWRSVYESMPAAFICSVPDSYKTDLGLYATGYGAQLTNQWSMNISVSLSDASILFGENGLKDSSLLRAYLGNIDEQIQIAQGYLDKSDPTFDLAARNNSGKVSVRADTQLMMTRAEGFEDILPQNVRYIPPDKPIKYVARSNGFWQLVEAKWPTIFFPGQYPSLVNRTVYQMQSSMEAFTGGSKPGGGEVAPGVYGNGGKIWQTKLHKKGSFYNDIVNVASSPTIQGAIQASVRMGDNYNQGNFSFESNNGCPVTATIVRQDGLIRRIDWSTSNCPSAPNGVWNRVAQESTMVGLITRSVQIGKKYMFVWEANSDFTDGSHLEDEAGRYWNSLVFDAPDFGSASYTPNLNSTKGRNKLYLMLSDYDETTPDWTIPADRISDPNWQDNQRWLHRYIAGGITATGLTVGKPADLKMQVIGGTIHCFYRPYTEPTRSLWRHAFSHNAGRFGAASFGLVARGHSGIQWDALWDGRNQINNCDNVVDFWDVRMSDGVQDTTIEESLKSYAWQGLTNTKFRSLVSESSISLTDGQLYKDFMAPPDYENNLRIENVTIDFDLVIGGNGVEAGVYCRASDAAHPKNDCVYIGLVANSDYKNGETNVLNCYAVKRVWADGGDEQSELRDYSPSPIHLKSEVTLPVRVTARGDLFSIWVAGNLIGSFGYYNETDAPPPETAKGFYFGLYAIGGSATFSNVRVPELFEIPTFSLLDVNQTMRDAMTKLIGKRRIKGVFRHDGALELSYFSWHDGSLSFENSLLQSSKPRTSRVINVAHVEGAYTHGIYPSPILLRRMGRHFQQFSNPDLMLPEHCYREAKAIVRESAEREEQTSFVGPSDVRLEPEDQTHITVGPQYINGEYIVDDVSFSFSLQKGKRPTNSMEVSTRKVAEV